MNRKRENDDFPSQSLMGLKKKTRIKVYSGTARNVSYTKVPTLEELCLQTLMDNYDKFLYLRNAPYYLIKPMLEKCSPNQLLELEYYNPYLTEDDDELWKWHVKNHYKGWERDEDESWRELYTRAEEGTKLKLRKITQGIKSKEKAKEPTRKTKLAYVDSTPKPPKAIKRLQEKHGTQSSSSLASGTKMFSNSTNDAFVGKKVLKKAPLMQNCLKLMKSMRR